MPAFTATFDGEIHAELDTHGAGRKLRWKRRTRARSIAYIHEPGQPSDGTSPLRRLKSCGLAHAPDVIIRVDQHHAYASGLIACGNIWTCPTCSARIRARREREIEHALALHCQAGANLGMLTLTLRHSRDIPLRNSIDNLNDAWRKLQRFHTFKPLRDLLAGTIATLEITYGANGWHPHLHIILLAGVDTTNTALTLATNNLRHAWSTLVNIHTDDASLLHGLNFLWFGSDSRTAATYITKLAKELTLTDTKSGTDPFALLDRTDAQATALYIEYAQATYRRQCHRWSDGLRSALALPPAMSDEELAQDSDPVGVEVLTIAREQWNHLCEAERLGWIEWAELNYNINGP